MPIKNVGDGNKEIAFGTGDINVGAGVREYDQSIGVLTFRDQNPQPIGTFTQHDIPENVNTFDIPVTMVFHKKESIDVLIRNLERVKDYMKREFGN
jgi:hypothetical protein